MDIEPARAEDCRGIAEVHVQAWQQAYEGIMPASFLSALSVDQREAMWSRMLANRSTKVIVARDNGDVVGFAAMGSSQRSEDSTAELWALYVRPFFWSRGVGRQLWLAALDKLRADGHKAVGLWVVANNQRAITFYEAAGFIRVPDSVKQSEIDGATINEVRYAFQI